MSKSRSFKNLYADAKAFFQEELWVKDLSALPRVRQLLFALCRVVMIVIRGFKDDQCSLQASALTYITLVSLVPMLAIMFSFSKGLGMQKRVLDKIGVERYQVEDASARDGVTWQYRVISNSNAPAADGGGTVAPPKKAGASAPGVVAGEQANASGLAQRLPEPMQKALVTVFNYVENTSFAALGLIGLLLLLFSVIGSMARLEESFNKIWGVKRGRPFLRKLSEYLVVLILLPVIFLIATSVNTLLLSNQFYTYLHEHVGFAAWLIEKLGALCGVAFVLSGFAFLYVFMPNTKVKSFPALMAGLTAGLLWYVVQWAFLSLQVGLTRYNTIYGTFAALPFFLAWLYANWSIILFGAEVSFAIQNHRTIHLEKASESMGTGACIILGQVILYEASKAFHDGRGSWNPAEFGRENSIPSRVLQRIVDVLDRHGVLIKVAGETAEGFRYVPGRDLAVLSPADVEEAFRESQAVDARAYMHFLPKKLRSDYTVIYGDFCQRLRGVTFQQLLGENAVSPQEREA
ncbi:MAG TPA: YihY/virulence factor BrkB family protein [Lentisphaeria bacterium]|nr:YihY/virulence factor BrkB family protein [Lentisphaerota bacterium]OQC11983.1 MAG: ribonuclease BN/unknown domain fusion protein [Lentisphaerae bacterium ADurb.Bin082]HPY90197.1 YihY/virulence factor BrkB family protein [Lentisphaeria bacterium]HQC53505.1 YihY/virulence factor BrkB family protein [Lentisphaeria bacterium]HQL86482.1 YihY/virulence factor BrkB family protein [Lentisphaeria bacterium]